jgi:hypothetical protein
MTGSDDIKVYPCTQGRIQVLWGLKLIQFWGPSLRERIQNYEYKINYESEYLFRALEGTLASEGP